MDAGLARGGDMCCQQVYSWLRSPVKHFRRSPAAVRAGRARHSPVWAQSLAPRVDHDNFVIGYVIAARSSSVRGS